MDRYWLRIVRAPIELEGNYARGLRKYYIYREIRVKKYDSRRTDCAG